MIGKGVLIGAAIALTGASPASAHPHIFIDTQIAISFNAAGLADGVRLSWAYDDLTSLQMIADRGFDADFDGVLTDAEADALSGFDMHWDAGYEGDTYVFVGDTPVLLQGPSDWGATYANDVVTSVHTRRFTTPVAVADLPLVVRVYDPSLYSGYFIVGEPTLMGSSHCTAEIRKPDLVAANKLFEAALAQMSGDVENDYPALGSAYAEEVRITCNAPS